jgi:hypothetical protein
VQRAERSLLLVGDLVASVLELGGCDDDCPGEGQVTIHRAELLSEPS